jgi:hypothetical protein
VNVTIKALALLRESNNFVGSVDLSSFWRLPKLTGLSLSNNKLSVMVGAENNSSSTHPSRLVVLSLACCHITKFPSILTHANNVRYLDLSGNNISGDIPNWIWEKWSSSLTYLSLSHNMFTGMRLNSSVLHSSTPLEFLDLSSNRLQGRFLCRIYQHEFWILHIIVSLLYIQTSLCILTIPSISECLTIV